MWFLVFLVTFSAGLFGAVIGAGGGFLIVPVLVLFLGFPVHEAVGISLLSVTATALSSFFFYASKRLVDYRLGVILEAATFTGALIGANLAISIRGEFIELALGSILIYVSYRMWAGSRNYGREGDIGKIKRGSYSRWVTGLVGSFAAGLVAGSLGVGGGILKVPIMTLILGTPMRTAVATSLFMICITAPTAASTYILNGLVNWSLGLAGAAGAALGAQIGGRIGMKIRIQIIRRVFAVLLLVFALMLIWKGGSLFLTSV